MWQHGVQAFKDAEADYIIAIGEAFIHGYSQGNWYHYCKLEFEDVRSLEGVAPTKSNT